MTVIGLLGATGYTGRLTLQELKRRGIDHRVGGRSPDKLAALGAADTVTVAADDRPGLERFMSGLDAVISCAGPFNQIGLPAVEAAVATGTPYVDSTGEPRFMSEVYARFASAASPVVPACGFDFIPGDLACAIAIGELDATVERVTVGYQLYDVTATRGTARSGVGAAADGGFRPERLVIDFPEGPRSAVSLPWGETLTVPRYAPTARVRTGVVAPDPVTRVLGALAPLLSRATPLVKAAQPALHKLVDRRPEGPTDDQREATRFRIVAQAEGGGRSARVLLTGRDPYGLTARLLVEAALSVKGAGAMSPAQALDPRGFLDAVGLDWQVL